MDYDLRKLSKFDRIGIMGGSFDPVHLGHLTVAEAARDEYGLDIVLFVPAGAAPHKDAMHIAPARHRYAMVCVAIKGNERFKASKLEVNSSGVTYSIDTIREIRARMKPGAELFFIIGADTAACVRTWKEYEQIEQLTTFIVLPRPGYDKTNDMPDNAVLLEKPMLDISSSVIRQRLRDGQSTQYLMPEAVIRYIEAYGLYKICKHTIPQIVRHAERTLSKKRYLHTMNVYETAARLCITHGADEKRTAVAALLHDCAKDMNQNQMLRACDKYGVKRAAIITKRYELAHSFVGAMIAAKEFGIRDKEILNAIKYHTTGRKDMSLIEKIVYVADCISPERDKLTNLEEMRKLAFTDIDTAMLIGLKSKIAYTKSKGEPVHKLSIEAVKFFEKNIQG